MEAVDVLPGAGEFFFGKLALSCGENSIENLIEIARYIEGGFWFGRVAQLLSHQSHVGERKLAGGWDGWLNS